MKIRVAMIADLPEPGEVINGGVQAVTSCLVPALGRLPAVELHVIRLRRGIDQTARHEQDGHMLHILPMSRLGTVTTFRQDQEMVDRCLGTIQPDIVHSQGAGHYGIIASRTGYSAVVTIHGILSEEVRFEQRWRSRLRAGLQARMSEKYCIRQARHTILISPYVADHYGDALGGQKYLIPNPVDDRFFEVARKDTGRTILFAGRVRKLKGVKDLLQAFARLRDRDGLRVVLAGSLAEESYVQEARSMCARLGIGSLVEFLGLVDTDRLVRELSECACLVLPSYQENAPMVVQEAMAAGVPVIASRVGGVPFQVEDARTGYLYEAGDVAALAARLDELMSSRELRDRIGAAAKSFADEQFRAAHVAERTLEVYRRVLGVAGAGRSETV
jgi:glycosyltransferase involved in cell wall biosynthesis